MFAWIFSLNRENGEFIGCDVPDVTMPGRAYYRSIQSA